MDAVEKRAKDTLAYLKNEFIPNLQSLCDYVEDCTDYYEENTYTDSTYNDDGFIENLVRVFEDFAATCDDSYRRTYTAMDEISVNYTGASFND